MWGRSIVALATIVVVLATGCSARSADSAPSKNAVGFAGSIDELTDRLDCEPARSDAAEPDAYTDWRFVETRDCVVAGRWFGRVHRLAERGDLSAALRQLGERYAYPETLVPCPDGSPPESPWIVSGENWLVITTQKHAAETAVSRLAGHLEAGGGRGGPPVSYPPMPCGQALAN